MVPSWAEHSEPSPPREPPCQMARDRVELFFAGPARPRREPLVLALDGCVAPSGYSQAVPGEHANARLVRDFHALQNSFYAGGDQPPVTALLRMSSGMCPVRARSRMHTVAAMRCCATSAGDANSPAAPAELPCTGCSPTMSERSSSPQANAIRTASASNGAPFPSFASTKRR